MQISKKKLKFTNWYLHENPQRFIREIFSVWKSCTGVGIPHSCSFHANFYNNYKKRAWKFGPFDNKMVKYAKNFNFLLYGRPVNLDNFPPFSHILSHIPLLPPSPIADVVCGRSLISLEVKYERVWGFIARVRAKGWFR